MGKINPGSTGEERIGRLEEETHPASLLVYRSISGINRSGLPAGSHLLPLVGVVQVLVVLFQQLSLHLADHGHAVVVLEGPHMLRFITYGYPELPGNLYGRNTSRPSLSGQLWEHAGS